MADKYHSVGSIVKVAISGTLVVLGSVESFDGPGGETQYYDGTGLDSGNLIEDGEMAGQVTPGEFSASIFYDPADATHSALAEENQTAAASRTYYDAQITGPDGTSTITMNGSGKSFRPKASAKSPYMADWSFKGRTLPVFA